MASRTIREVTFDLLRELELTTIFGNPGSTEETFLKDFPNDFRYIQTLHESSAVGAADGFAHTQTGNCKRSYIRRTVQFDEQYHDRRDEQDAIDYYGR